MLGENCRTGCPTKDHRTFGECARGANIQIDRYSLLTGADGGASPQVLEKRKFQTLERYRQLRMSGVDVQAPTASAVKKAEAMVERQPVKVTND